MAASRWRFFFRLSEWQLRVAIPSLMVMVVGDFSLAGVKKDLTYQLKFGFPDSLLSIVVCE